MSGPLGQGGQDGGVGGTTAVFLPMLHVSVCTTTPHPRVSVERRDATVSFAVYSAHVLIMHAESFPAAPCELPHDENSVDQSCVQKPPRSHLSVDPFPISSLTQLPRCEEFTNLAAKH